MWSKTLISRPKNNYKQQSHDFQINYIFFIYLIENRLIQLYSKYCANLFNLFNFNFIKKNIYAF